MPEGAWDILGDVSKSLYQNPVGTERVGGEQSLTMPDADVSPVVGAFGAHPITQATNERAHDIANTLAGMDAAPGVGSIKAFHGSPHSFERFDLAKIGTGEGAQAYGHGLYFAEHEPIAQSYRDNLSSSVVSWKGAPASPSEAANGIVSHMVETGGHLETPFNSANLVTDWVRSGQTPEQISARIKRGDWDAQSKNELELANRFAAEHLRPAAGHMYEVALHADPEHMLDWDKPLSEQHPKVREALERMGIKAPKYETRPVKGGFAVYSTATQQPATQRVFSTPDEAEAWSGGHGQNPSGGQLLDRIAISIPPSDLEEASLPQIQSKKLREAGIPGIRYLDAGSRAKGEGSRNYVVFDPDLIEILRRYGIAGIAGAGGAAHSLDWAPVGHDDKPGRPPAEAMEHLLEGHGTTFSNGQTWTLKDGRPERVDDADVQ